MSCLEATKLLEAIIKELAQLDYIKATLLIVAPPNVRVLPSKWAYKIKCYGFYKAHFVMRGINKD